MKNLAILAALLALPSLAFAPNDVSSGCRAVFAPLPWTVLRTVPAYTGTEPLESFTLDVCSGMKYVYKSERTNTNLHLIDDANFVNFGCWIDVYLQVSDQPAQFEHLVGFASRAPDYNVINWMQTFDGIVDFRGTSGVTVNVQDSTLAVRPFAVDPDQEDFFRQPFNVLISARELQPGDLGFMPGPLGFPVPVPTYFVGGGGSPVVQHSGQASAAAVFRWNVLSRTGW